eukprot:TRINITY_DN988_c1_g1_i1.p1 TRINITY_DN988_c1_g1~~TRINITY_DN988_c1_g1_i1.p1  ORF type:complete len:465 (+),score=86.97 TRINITY_DN988_c1_g1_i1:268-1662(+)
MSFDRDTVRASLRDYLQRAAFKQQQLPVGTVMQLTTVFFDACGSRNKEQRDDIEHLTTDVVSIIVSERELTRDECERVDRALGKMLRGDIKKKLSHVTLAAAGFEVAEPTASREPTERQTQLINSATPVLSRQFDDTEGALDVDDFWLLHRDYHHTATTTTTTTPTVKTVYTDGYPIHIVDNFLPDEECDWWSQKIFTLGEPSNLDKEFPPWYRSGYRLLIKSTATADRYFEKVSSIMGDTFPTCTPLGIGVPPGRWQPCGLNEAFRLIRYSEGNFFSIHRDANHNRSPICRSSKTLMVYLNDDFKGGDLVFTKQKEHSPGSEYSHQYVKKTVDTWPDIPDPPSWKNDQPNEALRITPIKGQAVIFDHWLIHYAEPVTEGHKSILRSDLMSQHTTTTTTTSSVSHSFGEEWQKSLSPKDQSLLPIIKDMSDSAEAAERDGKLNDSQHLFDALLELRLMNQQPSG